MAEVGSTNDGWPPWPGPGRPRASSWWPTTRPRDGVGGAGRGRRRRARRCWCRCCCGPAGAPPGRGRRPAWPRPTPAGEWPAWTPSLKWPNDLVVDGRGKLAGILAEAAGDGVVVGLGLNVNWGDDAAAAGGDVTGRGVGDGRRPVAAAGGLPGGPRGPLPPVPRRPHGRLPGRLLDDRPPGAGGAAGRRVVRRPGGRGRRRRPPGGRRRGVAAGDVVHVRSAS